MALPGGPPTHTEKTPRSHLNATPILLILLTGLSKLVGMLRSSLLASLCGVSGYASLLAALRRIPTTFFDLLFGAAMPLCFLPSYAASTNKERFSCRFATVFLRLTVVLSSLILLFSRPLSKLFFSEATAPELLLLRELLPISLFALPFMCGVSFFCTLRHAKGQHLRPAIVSLLANLILLLLLPAIGPIQNHFDAFAVTALLPLSFLIQFICIRMKVKKHTAVMENMQPPAFPWREYLRALLFSSFLPITQLLVLPLASQAPNGMAVYDYAATLFYACIGVLTVGTVQYFFPKLTGLPSHRLAEAASHALETSLTLTLPVSLFVCLFSRELVSLFYRHGAFSDGDIIPVATALSLLALALPCLTICELVGRLLMIKNASFFALIPTIIGMSVLILLIILRIDDASLAILLSYASAAIASLLCLARHLSPSALHPHRPLLASVPVCLLYLTLHSL